MPSQSTHSIFSLPSDFLAQISEIDQVEHIAEGSEGETEDLFEYEKRCKQQQSALHKAVSDIFACLFRSQESVSSTGLQDHGPAGPGCHACQIGMQAIPCMPLNFHDHVVSYRSAHLAQCMH